MTAKTMRTMMTLGERDHAATTKFYSLTWICCASVKRPYIKKPYIILVPTNNKNKNPISVNHCAHQIMKNTRSPVTLYQDEMLMVYSNPESCINHYGKIP